MGNMTSRDEAGSSWIQPFTADGRLESVTDQGNSDEWGFIYNGDGARVGQSNPDGTTTLFIAGGSYEVVIDGQGEEISIRKYYALGGQHVTREDDSNYYLLTDHLGSVVGVANGSGSLISEQGYMPYGVPRLEPGIDETDFGFTGQRGLEAIGLMDYKARWYSATASRFTQADTAQQASSRSMNLNSYGYAIDNPVRYSDPTGHYVFEEYPDDMIVGSDPQIRSVDWRHHPEVKLKSPSDSELLTTLAEVAGIPLIVSLLPEFRLSGHLESEIDTLNSAGWKLVEACSRSVACWSMIGAAGSPAQETAINGIPTSDLTIPNVPNLGIAGRDPTWVRELHGFSSAAARRVFEYMVKMGGSEAGPMEGDKLVQPLADGSVLTLIESASSASEYMPEIYVNSPLLDRIWKIVFYPW